VVRIWTLACSVSRDVVQAILIMVQCFLQEIMDIGREQTICFVYQMQLGVLLEKATQSPNNSLVMMRLSTMVLLIIQELPHK